MVGQADSLLYRRGNFNGTFDDMICAALLKERDAEIALSPGFRWGTSVLPGQPITVEDIHNATAITYPQVYRMSMTGERLKEVLEDVADNLFNPDPYYQQGGDMVRCGGLGYAIDMSKPIGQRISAMTQLKSGKADRAEQGIHRRRLGQRQRGHARPAGVGTCGALRGGGKNRARDAQQQRENFRERERRAFHDIHKLECDKSVRPSAGSSR